MNISYLESFYYVVRHGGFSAAADYLGVSKGLVSRHVNHLEAELKTTLLLRTTRRLSMTEAGEQLYAKAEQIFTLAQNAHQEIIDITEDSGGSLRFTSPFSIGKRVIQEILPLFCEQCPKVKVELNFSNQDSDIAGGENDIGLRTADTLPDDLVGTFVGRIQNKLVASPAYLTKAGMPLVPTDLLEHQCILNSHNQDWNTWSLQKSGHMTEITATGMFAANTYATVKQLALTHYGIASIPAYEVDSELCEEQLHQVLSDYQLPVHKLFIIHAVHRQLPQKLRFFKTLLLNWFTQHQQYFVE